MPPRLRLLGTIHALLGLYLLVAPLSSSRLFGLLATPSTHVITRMLGCRDLVLGGAILLAEYRTAEGRQRGQLLIAANWVNGIDFVAVLVSYLEGSLEGYPWVLLEGGAAGNLVLGVWEAAVRG